MESNKGILSEEQFQRALELRERANELTIKLARDYLVDGISPRQGLINHGLNPENRSSIYQFAQRLVKRLADDSK